MTDPRRWREPDGEAPPGVRELFANAQRASDLDPALRARIAREVVDPAVQEPDVRPSPAYAEGMRNTPRVTLQKAAAALVGTTLWAKGLLAAAAIVGAGFATVHVFATTPREPSTSRVLTAPDPRPPSRTSRAILSAPSREPSPSPVSVPPAPLPTPAPPSPRTARGAPLRPLSAAPDPVVRNFLTPPRAPRVLESPSAPPAGVPLSEATSANTVTDPLQRETDMLDDVREALRDGDPAAALRRLAVYDAAFPTRQLSAQRDHYMIRALLGLGRVAEARVLGNAFRHRYPTHPRARDIEHLVNGDASAP